MEAPLPPLNDRLDALFLRTTAGVKPGLEVISGLLQRLGQPQQKFLTIHVAGTNGKGSVCAMLSALLQEHGLHTGLYTSPHLVRFNERIRIQGEVVEDEELVDLLNAVEAVDRQQVAAGQRPATFFEMATAMAFLCFARRGVQVAVIETGMGGRWDATNVIQSVLSVITPISMDHMDYLGTSLEGIAREKAGIIKAGRPVILADQSEEVRAVLTSTAHDLGSPIHAVDQRISCNGRHQTLAGQRFHLSSSDQDYGQIHLSLLGQHQIANAATALCALEVFLEAGGGQAVREAVRNGFKKAVWPGRLEVLGTAPPVLLDGAHNPEGALRLSESLTELFGKKKGAFVMGFSRDKAVGDFLKILAPHWGKAWAVAARSSRALSPEELTAIEPALLPVSIPEALEAATRWATAEDAFVCICGSLYLVGEIKSLPQHS